MHLFRKLIILAAAVYVFQATFSVAGAYSENREIPKPAPEVSRYAVFGKVRLPDGQTAPEGGIRVRVVAEHYYGGESTSILIPKGSNSADYRLEAYTTAPLKAHYQLDENYGFVMDGRAAAYRERVPKSTEGSKWENEMDIELIPGDCTIMGTVTLPEGMRAAYGGEQLTVNAKSLEGESYSRKVTIREGMNAADYFLCIPSRKEYTVSYRLNAPRIPLLETGYYHENFNISLIAVPGKMEYIDLQIIHSADGFKQILNRALTEREAQEVMEKAAPGTVSISPVVEGNVVKFIITSETIDKWEKWAESVKEDKDAGQKDSGNFRLKGFYLYSFDKSSGISRLVASIGKSGRQFSIKPASKGTMSYYCQAAFENNLRSSKSNSLRVLIRKDPFRIEISGSESGTPAP